MKSTVFASALTFVAAQSEMIQTNGGPQFKMEWDSEKSMFKINAEVPQNIYLDLIYNDKKSDGTDFVEFNANTKNGFVLDRHFGNNEEVKFDPYNQYKDTSIIKQNGIYYFQVYREAKAHGLFGKGIDSDIVCGQKNTYMWEVHSDLRSQVTAGGWTLDLNEDGSIKVPVKEEKEEEPVLEAVSSAADVPDNTPEPQAEEPKSSEADSASKLMTGIALCAMASGVSSLF